MKIKRSRYLEIIFVVLVGLLPGILFKQALAPGLQLEDSSEFITVVLTLGIPHPSGYPLYVVLAHGWSRLIGLTPWSVNFFSAVVAMGAAIFIYLSARSWGAARLPAWAASWLLCGWPAFWSQALLAEVYTLHVFLLAVLFYLAAKLNNRPRPVLFYSLAVLAGLAAANHLLAALWWPVAVWLFFKHRSYFKNRQWWLVGLSGLLGLAVYLYLPARAAAEPLLNWGDPSSWSRFWWHILRLGYHDLGWHSVQGSKWNLLGSLIEQLIDGWGWPVLVILVCAWPLTYRRYKTALIFLLLSFISQVAPVIILRDYGWGLGTEFTYSVYWSGAVAALAVWLALSLTSLLDWLGSKYLSVAWWRWLTPILLLSLLPWSVWYRNWWSVNYRGDNWPDYYATTLLSSLPPRAILFVWGDDYANDSILFTLAYTQLVKKLRPDVTIVDGGVVFPMPVGLQTDDEEDYWRSLWQWSEQSKRPLYSTTLPTLLNSSLTGRLDGYSYRIFGSPAEARLAIVKPLLLRPEAWTVERMNYYSGQDYLAHLLYGQALALWEVGRLGPARTALLDAIDLDNQPLAQDYLRFVRHRAWLNLEP